MTTVARPGGQIARRPLHFFLLVDCSGSMALDGRIQALNTAVREAIPHMRRSAAANVGAEVFIRVIAFSNGAHWHVAEPMSVHDFSWSDVTASGVTDLGAALRLLTEAVSGDAMPQRALPPVAVLVSDGQPTDDFEAALAELVATDWGAPMVRLAIAIGRDADREVLQSFIGNAEVRPVSAAYPEALVEHIRWASTAGLSMASTPSTTAVAGATPPPLDPSIAPVW